MKALVLLASLFAAAPSYGATMPAALDQDPLMKQILAKQLTHPNGGITAAVAVRGAKDNKGIELAVTDPLAPLAPAEGLAAREEARPARRRNNGRAAARSKEQAEVIDAAGPAASFDRAAK